MDHQSLDHPPNTWIYKGWRLDLAIVVLCFLAFLFWFLERVVFLILIMLFDRPARRPPRIKRRQIDQLMPAIMVKISSDDDDDDEYGGGGSNECTICLEEFKDGEWCRVFPHCSHEFHVLCIDAWLARRNLTCPVCRSSLDDHHDAITANDYGDNLV
jgi:hypothetical protein